MNVMEKNAVFSRQPSLYRCDESGNLTIIGSSCRFCRKVSCPSGRYGCPHCGAAAEAQDLCDLSGQGSLKGFVLVNVDLPGERSAPYIVGTIALEEGPIIEGILLASGDPVYSLDQRVRAVAVRVTGDSEHVNSFECQFATDGQL
jgi:uncharacterized OB-fold protein